MGHHYHPDNAQEKAYELKKMFEKGDLEDDLVLVYGEESDFTYNDLKNTICKPCKAGKINKVEFFPETCGIDYYVDKNE